MEYQKGQALITLLFFTIVGIAFISSAVAILTINAISASKFDQGVSAYYVAEGGAENAYLRLIRNPSYTGETLSVGAGTATITVSGSNPYIIQSKGQSGNFIRTIEVDATYANGQFTITSWREI